MIGLGKKKMDNQDYIYVGSYEKCWKPFNYIYQLKTESSWVLVNYSTKYDSILEEHVMFNEELDEGLTINQEITITDFEKQVETQYPSFVVNNIKLLRTST